MEIEIVITCLLLVALTFLATVDMAFGQLSDVGLRRLAGEAEEHPASGTYKFLRTILADRPRFRFTLSASVQILLIIFSVLVTMTTLRYFQRRSLLITISLAACLILAGVFRQFVPHFIAWRNPEKVLLSLLPIVRPFYWLMVLFTDPFGFLVHERPAPEINEEDEEDDNGDDIKALTDVGEAEGILEEEDSELIHSIIEFGDTTVKEVMTPRTEIVALSITATVKEAREVMIDSKCSRIPVYRGQIDDIVGLLFMRDLLQCWTEGEDEENIKPLIRPVFFVPETKLVDDLLEEMQKAHVQLAMVIDEYGGVAGLVTVEDILEEIVGEIEDEDTAQEEIIEIIEGEEGYYDVLGSTEIGKIERLFDMEIEADDFTTIAGLVISESGYVPRVGEHLSFRGIDVEVLKADDRKINLLRLRKAEINGKETSKEEEEK
jgi:CBS domain containing-hemolysin-like protein